MYALAKTKPRVWLKLSCIHQKLVQFCQNPLKYVTICCSNFCLLSANGNPYFGRNRTFTETPNTARYQNLFGLSLAPAAAGSRLFSKFDGDLQGRLVQNSEQVLQLGSSEDRTIKLGTLYYAFMASESRSQFILDNFLSSQRK